MSVESQVAIQCPACNGTGKLQRVYVYKSQHRSDSGGGQLLHEELCTLCSGNGIIAGDRLRVWQELQSLRICPSCQGSGGRRYWHWNETEKGTQKSFEFIPCKVCGGHEHVSIEQIAAHNRERRNLQVWGVGCVGVVLVVGICGISRAAALLMGNTPWVQCCAFPQFLLPGLLLLAQSIARMY